MKKAASSLAILVMALSTCTGAAFARTSHKHTTAATRAGLAPAEANLAPPTLPVTGASLIVAGAGPACVTGVVCL